MTATAVRSLLRDESTRRALEEYLAPRAADVDACRADVRDGIAHISRLVGAGLGVYGVDPPERFAEMCEVLATVAFDDMSQAFSLWCHRMAIEYLHQADPGCGVHDLLPRLGSAETLGSTAFAAATANVLAGTPLTLRFRRRDGGIVVNGRIAWASNLAAPFLSIAAAANEDDPEDRVVFAYSEATPGLELPAYPALLALQATNSTSPVFTDAVVEEDAVLTWDLERFVRRVLPTFLLLQSSFCWGLASRALTEAATLLAGPALSMTPAYKALLRRFDAAEERLRGLAGHPERTTIDHRALLELRLELGRLAVESVGLESKLAGGRGYLVRSGTARRLREAAFLPVQAPTEVQLQWLLTRSA